MKCSARHTFHEEVAGLCSAGTIQAATHSVSLHTVQLDFSPFPLMMLYMNRMQNARKTSLYNHLCCLCFLSSASEESFSSDSIDGKEMCFNSEGNINSVHPYSESLQTVCSCFSTACVSPCALQILLLGFLLAALSWFEVLQDKRVCLSAPLRQRAQELREKHWY